MDSIPIELTFRQLLNAIRQLSREQKVKLWQLLDAEIMGHDVDRDLDLLLNPVTPSQQGVSEDEVMADALAAIGEYRAEEAARRA